MPQTRVHLRGAGEGDVGVVEEAVAAVPGATSVRSVRCGEDSVVVVDGPDAAAVTAGLQGALAKLQLTGPPPVVERVAEPVVVFSVRAADPLDRAAARAAAEQVRAALAGVAGVQSVDVVGGKREKQVLLDLQRLLAKDVTVLEALRAAGGAASLEATIVKTNLPPEPKEPGAMMMKAPNPPLRPGEVRVLLPDVADIGLFPAGEPLRRDGAVEVRVHGDPAQKDAFVKAARGASLPAGATVAVLDDDSLEGVDLVVAAASPAQLESLQKELLAVPGVRLAPPSMAVRVALDPAKTKELAMSADDVAAINDIVGRGRTVMRNTENVKVRLGGDAPVDALGQLMVARTGAWPVRLSDIAALRVEPARSDRLERRPAVRLSVLFDVGVRKNALLATEQIAARTRAEGVFVSVERADVSGGRCQ